MDLLGENFAKGNNDVDPAADFLAREQSDLEGLDDLVPSANSNLVNGDITQITDPLPETVLSDDFVIDDLVSNDKGGFSSQIEENGFDIIESPEDSPPFTAIDESNHVEEPKNIPEEVKQIDESEKILKWREEQRIRLEKKDKEEEIKKEELRENAKKELEEWYKHHEEQIAKTKTANRESAMTAEKEYVMEQVTVEPGMEWERIAKMCDFNSKTTKSTKDVSRMRSILLQLKQNPIMRS